MKFGFDRPSGFRGEDVWTLLTATTITTMTTDYIEQGHTISSPCKTNGPGEL